MTVKLLMDWPDSRDGKQYVAGNLLTTDAGTESGLVAAKMATSNLAGGTAYIAPVAQKQNYPVMGGVDPLTGGISIISKLTQAQYDALAVKDASTLYVIVP